MVKPGDVVLCRFPKSEGGWLWHPALVLEVNETLSGAIDIRAAYGSSKKTHGLLPWEFVIGEEDGRGFEVSGLRMRTRFDLRTTAHFNARSVKVIGVLHSCLHARFREAARALHD